MVPVLIVGLAVAVSSLANAQPSRVSPQAETARPQSQSQGEAQALWNNYRAGRVAHRDAAQVLERVLASRSLPATHENTAAILRALNKSKRREQTVALLRLAGAQHHASSDQQNRADIERVISAMTSAADEAIASAAVLTYARMGYFPDTLPILSNARRKLLISDDDYFGDLAHLLPDAPQHSRAVLVKELASGQNDFSREVLAGLLKDATFSRSLAPAEAAALLAHLGAEPGFSAPAHQLGGMEALRYENWLYASVALEARIRSEPERVALARLLKADAADPRKLIAALWTPQGGVALRAAYSKAALVNIDTAIAGYAQAHGKDPWIQEITTTARRNLASAAN